jgi:hypothetical protein
MTSSFVNDPKSRSELTLSCLFLCIVLRISCDLVARPFLVNDGHCGSETRLNHFFSRYFQTMVRIGVEATSFKNFLLNPISNMNFEDFPKYFIFSSYYPKDIYDFTSLNQNMIGSLKRPIKSTRNSMKDEKHQDGFE